MSIWDDAYQEYQHVNDDGTEAEEVEVEISDQPEAANRYIKIVAYISEDIEITKQHEKRMAELELRLATATKKIKQLEKRLKESGKTHGQPAKNTPKRPHPSDKKDV